MRRFYLICSVAIISLLFVARASAGVRYKEPVNAAKASTTETSLTSAFSSSDAEIELTVLQLFKPAPNGVDKKEPLHASLADDGALSNVNIDQRYSAKLLAVNAANNYKLLFPFHHFW